MAGRHKHPKETASTAVVGVAAIVLVVGIVLLLMLVTQPPSSRTGSAPEVLRGQRPDATCAVRYYHGVYNSPGAAGDFFFGYVIERGNEPDATKEKTESISATEIAAMDGSCEEAKVRKEQKDLCRKARDSVLNECTQLCKAQGNQCIVQNWRTEMDTNCEQSLTDKYSMFYARKAAGGYEDSYEGEMFQSALKCTATLEMCVCKGEAGPKTPEP